jgi:hypothetical protein
VATQSKNNKIEPLENSSSTGAIFVPPIIPISQPFFTGLNIHVKEKIEISVKIVYILIFGRSLNISKLVLKANINPANRVI